MSATSNLIHRLTALGLTQTAIAKRTGIPQPRLSRWAAGRPAAGADDALRLQALVAEVEQAGIPQPEEVSHVE